MLSTVLTILHREAFYLPMAVNSLKKSLTLSLVAHEDGLNRKSLYEDGLHETSLDAEGIDDKESCTTTSERHWLPQS